MLRREDETRAAPLHIWERCGRHVNVAPEGPLDAPPTAEAGPGGFWRFMVHSEAHELVGTFAEMLVEVRDPAELWPRMLRHLHHALGFDAGYIAATWGSAMEGRGAVLEHDEPFLKKNLGRFLAEISPSEVSAYTERARNHGEVWPLARQRQLAVFNELLMPTGMRHMLVRVSVRHGNVAGFNLERRGLSRPFSERETRLVDVVTPFLHIVELLTLENQEDRVTQDFARAHALSKRETEFLNLLVRGLQNAEIAMVTRVSVNTVRNTLARLFDKVDVSTRAELTFAATRFNSDLRPKRGAPPSARGGRLPDDGMSQFRSRIEAATPRRARPAAERKPAPVAPPIIYTPPLERLP